jgi:hypothetical protein
VLKKLFEKIVEHKAGPQAASLQRRLRRHHFINRAELNGQSAASAHSPAFTGLLWI